MGIVYRNGRPYYYRSVRQGDRVVSKYMGSGENGLLFALFDRIDREERENERLEGEEQQQEFDDLDKALDEMAERARALAHEALTRAGYHQHHRGEWRKRRGKRDPTYSRADNGWMGE